MNAHVTFRLNGTTHSLPEHSDPRESLLRWLKRQNLTGTKEGCGDGDCGACTVAEVLRPNGRIQLRTLNSCLLPIGQAADREFITVEALAGRSGLHPTQAALINTAGSQCGYCTPGFVMSLFVGFHENELGDHAIDGNLCRCTGYVPIRRAMTELEQIPVATRVESLPTFLDQTSDRPPSQDLPEFLKPQSLPAAVAAKQSHPDYVWIAGATDSGVALSRGQKLAAGFISLDHLPELDVIERHDGTIRIGAGVSMTRLERELAGELPILAQMLPWFAARQVKNRATVGGNIGSASPIGDLLPCLLAWDADIELLGPAGRRSIPAAAYFVDYRKTQRAEPELITAISFKPPLGRQAFLKVAKRQTDDISIVAAAFVLDTDAEHRVVRSRLAYGGVAAIPKRATASEALLIGRHLDAETIDMIEDALRTEFSPLSDHRASKDYRSALIGNLFRQFAEATP